MKYLILKLKYVYFIFFYKQKLGFGLRQGYLEFLLRKEAIKLIRKGSLFNLKLISK